MGYIAGVRLRKVSSTARMQQGLRGAEMSLGKTALKTLNYALLSFEGESLKPY